MIAQHVLVLIPRVAGIACVVRVSMIDLLQYTLLGTCVCCRTQICLLRRVCSLSFAEEVWSPPKHQTDDASESPRQIDDDLRQSLLSILEASEEFRDEFCLGVDDSLEVVIWNVEQQQGVLIQREKSQSGRRNLERARVLCFRLWYRPEKRREFLLTVPCLLHVCSWRSVAVESDAYRRCCHRRRQEQACEMEYLMKGACSKCFLPFTFRSCQAFLFMLPSIAVRRFARWVGHCLYICLLRLDTSNGCAGGSFLIVICFLRPVAVV